MNKRLLIATLDPKNAGGILSMMRAVYHLAARDGFKSRLAYNRIAGFRHESEPHTLRSGGTAQAKWETIEGMDGCAVERVLPEFEFLNYSLNRRAWGEALAGSDVFFGVCGNPLAALPLALAGKRYSIWVATPLYEDRIDRLQTQPLIRRLRDILSLPLLLRQERYVLRKAERILALSGYTRAKFIEKYPELEAKISTVPYPIDVGFFSPYKTEEREPYLLFTGRLEDPRKNVAMLLRAFESVRANHPEIKLRMIGGVLPPQVEAIARKLNLEDAIEVLPLQPRELLLQHYRSASIFVLPSFQEGLCISALEAMSAGLPVISTRCGGPEEFVADGNNGYLVANNDPEAFATAVSKFLGLAAAKRQSMSQEARATVARRYAEEVVWPKFLASFK